MPVLRNRLCGFEIDNFTASSHLNHLECTPALRHGNKSRLPFQPCGEAALPLFPERIPPPTAFMGKESR
jgi:hypothetical protein